MTTDYLSLTADNIGAEHLCCAIADKKHQKGVEAKREWLKERISEGHVFRKLNVNGKVFIEYAPLERAWVPVNGENYVYIYCLWVSGSFKGKGYGTELLEYCIADARRQGKSGVCAITAKKKKPFISDRTFLERFGFRAADTIGDEYILSSLSFDGTLPGFSQNAKKQSISGSDLTIYYGVQCPYIPDCIEQISRYCASEGIPLALVPVDTLEKAKAVPCVFNNWAVFYGGRFETVHLLNEGFLKKMLRR
jgi:N-acetylglutamate synthase-like GNAT family acetyltransferase